MRRWSRCSCGTSSTSALNVLLDPAAVASPFMLVAAQLVVRYGFDAAAHRRPPRRKSSSAADVNLLEVDAPSTSDAPRAHEARSWAPCRTAPRGPLEACARSTRSRTPSTACSRQEIVATCSPGSGELQFACSPTATTLGSKEVVTGTEGTHAADAAGARQLRLPGWPGSGRRRTPSASARPSNT